MCTLFLRNMSFSLTLLHVFVRSMILASFVMIQLQYNFITMKKFLLPLRLLLLDWKSGLLVMIVERRYTYMQSIWCSLSLSQCYV